MNDFFTYAITEWYKLKKRDLPWRNTVNPYFIWLSEIILQQTRVAQGMSYYLNFVKHFPTVHDLALASEQDVLKLWQGLGYYSRARNLHATARDISINNNGEFPADFEGLLKLKGVGHYTASAIASFAYDEKVAVLDGNVFRVLSRFYGIGDAINTPAGSKIFRAFSAEILPLENTQAYNQGIMEFGALQCVPKNPECEICVLQDKCVAFLQKKVSVLPVKLKKTKVKELFIHFFVIVKEGKVKLLKREGAGIWQNLWEFPNVVLEVQQGNMADVNALFLGKYNSGVTHLYGSSKEYKHLLSHRRIYAKFHLVKLDALSRNAWESVSLGDFENYPIHRLIDKYIEDYGLFDLDSV